MSQGVEDIYELSPLQQGMLLHTLYGGDSDTYVAQHSFAIDGPLDHDALMHAWQRTVGSHTALRSSFHWEGLNKPLQVVHRAVGVEMQSHDWRGIGDDILGQRIDDLLARERTVGFDVAKVPLLRLHLVRHADERHIFVWTHHMLPVDGWSVPIIISDVVRWYRCIALGYPPPPAATPYRDYIAWLQRQDLAAAKSFWADALRGGAQVNRLGPLLPDRHDGEPATVDERTAGLPAELHRALRAMAARQRVTFNTVIQAAWAIVMQRFTGAPDVQFGFASSGRPPELPGVDRMVGTFVNSLPLRLTVPDDADLGEWLRDVQTVHSTARRFEYSPLAQIKAWAGVAATQPLFDSLLVLENYRVEYDAGELVQRLSLRGLTDFEKTSEPLTVFVTGEPGSVLRVLYHRERIPGEAVEDILRDFCATLAGMAEYDRVRAVVAAVSSARDPEPAAIGAVVRYADAGLTLAELIERQAAATPDRPAVIADGGMLTYRQLLDSARRVAAALALAGAGPGHVVGVSAERSLDLVANLVGTLLAGAAYLPLDPDLPAARLALIRADADVRIALASPHTAEAIRNAGAGLVLTPDQILQDPAGTRGRAAGGLDVAYVIYTSGSTGQPKGVMVSHQAIVNRLLWMQDVFALTPDDRVLQKTPLGFDVSVWEVFWPLLCGAVTVLARPGGHQDAEYLARTIDRHSVTTAHFVPSMLQLFLDEPTAAQLPSLRRVACSGEALPLSLVQRFQSLLPRTELHNLYGPTEAAVDVTWWDCARSAPDAVLPIGDAVANTQAYVLDRRLIQVPRTVPGELYLGGLQLAHGYLSRPGLTASRFVAHPLAGPGGRLYRTGDKVRRLSDGSLEFLGRFDFQVKVHGYRIELGEIEQLLDQHPAVREAVVVVREKDGAKHLAAYVTGCAGAEMDARSLREYLQGHLPRHMLPATFTVLPAMPVSWNGKLDRTALPGPSPVAPAGGECVAPATPEEKALATVFCDVLDLAEIDVTESFFDLGGNSFDAVRAIRRIEGATIGLLAAHSSVRALAAALQSADDRSSMLLRLTEPRPASRTLVCVPFGGGSAIAYQPLARAVDSSTALLAVAMPGHEIGGDPGLRPLEDVAGECAQAVLDQCAGRISIYAHCVGVALAIEIVRRLESAGRNVERLFIGGALPYYRPGPIGRSLQRGLGALVSRRILPVSDVTVGLTGRDSAAANLAEMVYLRSIGGFANDVDPAALAFIMRAFRHDAAEGGRYFAELWKTGSDTPPLETPITFIAGTHDPLTLLWDRRAKEWERFSRTVNLAAIPGGKHYFLQQHAGTLATIIERVLAAVTG